jgi:dihydrofolate reductase
MRKVVAGAFVSLDGVMQAPGGPEEDPTGGFKFGGWTVPFWDEAMMARMGESFTEEFELLLGRKTYEIFAAHWPFMSNDDQIAPVFNRVKKYVASRQGVDLTWQNSVALKDAAADVAKLKQGEGPTLLVQGSSDLVQTLLAHDLIDELKLLIFPLVLGKGKKLFGAGAVPRTYKASNTVISSTGVVMSHYALAGDAKTGHVNDIESGSFAIDKPSDLEMKRRARMEREG